MANKTVILLEIFSFGLINFGDLSTTFFIQRFLTILFFSYKTHFLKFLFLGLTFFYNYAFNHTSHPTDSDSSTSISRRLTIKRRRPEERLGAIEVIRSESISLTFKVIQSPNNNLSLCDTV